MRLFEHRSFHASSTFSHGLQRRALSHLILAQLTIIAHECIDSYISVELAPHRGQPLHIQIALHQFWHIGIHAPSERPRFHDLPHLGMCRVISGFSESDDRQHRRDEQCTKVLQQPVYTNKSHPGS